MEKRLTVTALHTLILTSAIARRFLLCFIISFSLVCANAQTPITIKGTVTDDKGAPLSSASIVLKGTKLGTVTNNTGNYSFTTNETGVLIFSYAGYLNKEIAISSSQTLDVSLTPTNVSLNDVVVTGYSRQSKRDVTGAASTISAQAISQTPITDLTGVIQGRVAGVSVDQQGGPG
ncbi:MAG TPA: carboxypeptidase-like regulatory domain-containing protein, partial [Parafilimonas sp.]